MPGGKKEDSLKRICEGSKSAAVSKILVKSQRRVRVEMQNHVPCELK